MPSSVVSHISYNAQTATLRITYVSGTVYDYLDVPEDVYNEMKKAFSKGTYLNLHIKGKYDFVKVN